jgi:hypothetical protein
MINVQLANPPQIVLISMLLLLISMIATLIIKSLQPKQTPITINTGTKRPRKRQTYKGYVRERLEVERMIANED